MDPSKRMKITEDNFVKITQQEENFDDEDDDDIR